jgi:putative ABC transport system permease protein
VLLFTFSVALMTGVMVGLVPALGAGKVDVHESLKATAHVLSGGKGRKLRSALVICELSLALAVLVSAGLMIKALAHLHKVDIGFNPNHLLSAKVPLEGSYYDDTQHQVQFFQELLRRIETIPGVIAASVSRGVPMAGWAGWNFVTADNANPAAGDVPDANYVVIGPDYFETMQIPLREGRRFTAFDIPRSQPVAIVSESLAQKYWHGKDPVGQRLKVSRDARDETEPWLTIVGVAGNVRTQGQYAPFLPEIYVPYTQYPWVLSPRNILLRTSGDPLRMVPEIRRAVAMLDKGVPLAEITPMQQVVAGPMQQGQTIMWLLGAFAGLALLLAAVGIYSVISYAVSQRTHEIGVRMALGATRGDVSGLVVKQGSILTAIGVAAGLLGALAITRALLSLPFQARWLLLFDVRPTDPLILGAISAILSGIALLASFVPAHRAARIDPLVALRYE